MDAPANNVAIPYTLKNAEQNAISNAEIPNTIGNFDGGNNLSFILYKFLIISDNITIYIIYSTDIK